MHENVQLFYLFTVLAGAALVAIAEPPSTLRTLIACLSGYSSAIALIALLCRLAVGSVGP